jgi:hypothetical protein
VPQAPTSTPAAHASRVAARSGIQAA